MIWIVPERDRLRSRYVQALEELGWIYEEQREYTAAIPYAQQLLRTEPLHEAAHRRLMRLYVLSGDRAAALRTYNSCVTLLERELGVGPGEAIREAYQRLLQQEAPAVLRHRSGPLGQNVVPLIGREAEWQTLLSRWRRIARGHAHFVLIAGEPGIGKTRLAEELLTWADRQGIGSARARSYAAAGELAYAPVIDWLRQPIFQASLDEVDDVWLAEISRLLPEIQIAHPAQSRPGPVDESWQRRRLFEALANVVTVDQRPKLLLIDDLQWCDSETLAWLAYLMVTYRQTPLLILGTIRPEEIDRDHPLNTLLFELCRGDRLTELELGPLSPDETLTLAAHESTDLFDVDKIEDLFEYTEGNPLYIVETVRAAMGQDEDLTAALKKPIAELEPALADLPASTLPVKVRTTIQRRLGQLSPEAYDLACLAAIVGRSFSYAVLAHACDLDAETLMNRLDELWQRRIVVDQSEATYDFTHDRIREVALVELSPVGRQRLHFRVAQALESLYPDKSDVLCGQLGWHYAEALQRQEALHYYRQAAKVSAEIAASDRALVYLEKALLLLDQLPDTPDHIALCIDCWLDVASAQIDVHGWTSIERKAALDRALQWAENSRGEQRQIQATIGLSTFYVSSGDWVMAIRLAQRAFEHAQELGDDQFLYSTTHHRAFISFFRGEVGAALDQYRQTIALQSTLISDPSDAVGLHSWLAEARWHAGYPEQALETAAKAVQLADESGMPGDKIHSREYMMYTTQRAGELATMRRLTLEVLDLCAQYGFPDYVVTATVHLGWLTATAGDLATGLTQIEEALDTAEQMNMRFNYSYLLSLLACGQHGGGLIEQALRSLERALDFSETSEELYWRAELLRLTGDYRLDVGHPEHDAEDMYATALALTRQQRAKMLELRTTVSLAKLWRSQGKSLEAHQALTTIYGWFSEGFQSADLCEGACIAEPTRP